MMASEQAERNAATPGSLLSPRAALCLLGAACLLFTAALTWGFQSHFYEHDFFYDIWHCLHGGGEGRPWLANVFSADFSRRFHPVYFLIKKFQFDLFGFHQQGYIATNLLIHSGNAFLVYFLCRRFGAGVAGSLGAALLFLTSYLSWGTVISIPGLCREAGLFFYLLGILCFVRQAQRNPLRVSFAAVGCVTASLLAVEDGVTFPALLIASSLCLPKPEEGKRWTPGMTGTVALSSLVCAAFALATLFAGGDEQCHVGYGWHSLQKILILPREIVQNLFIPHRTWGLPDMLALRLLPAALILGLGAWFFRNDKIRDARLAGREKGVLYFSLAWIAITILPYLSRPSGWAWYTRYFYFPSVGIFMLAGYALTRCYRGACSVFSNRALASALLGAVMLYTMAFGTVSNILIWQKSCFKIEPTYTKERLEAERMFGLLNAIRSVDPAGLAPLQIVVTGSPLPLPRLEQLTRDVLNLGITLVDKTKDLQPGGPPTYAIAYACGRWGKISVIKNNRQ